MSTQRRGLSKSRFVAGWQCHRQLWWRAHEPEAPELVADAGLLAVFGRGRAVGEVARSYVPGGALVDLPHDDVPGRLRATAEAMSSGAPAVYEASFVADGVFAAVDVLERSGGGWNLIEVKSTTEAKPEHEPDVAVQLRVLEAAGLDVGRVELMHLNRECRFPDLSNLFAREDLTTRARALQPRVRAEIDAQLRMLDGPLPGAEPGERCDYPYECPFKGRCLPALPDHHVTTLYRIGKKAAAMTAAGMSTIRDVPRSYPLPAIASRHRLAVQEGRVVVEPGLRAALAKWRHPIAFLDFETIAPAIPVWNGCRPYDPVPVQFSCHVLGEDGSLTHTAWIADGPGDPREELVARVCDAVEGAWVILGWNASYELRCLNEIKACLPHLGPSVDRVAQRIDDMLAPVRSNLYHPDFGGSFSIKKVLPALLPDLGYNGMAIQDGQAASDALEAMLLRCDAAPAEARAALRENLLAYCRLDTYAMVALFGKLRELA